MNDPCEWCGSERGRGRCPLSIKCPECNAGPGKFCSTPRPSGHRLSARFAGKAKTHEARYRATERADGAECTHFEPFSTPDGIGCARCSGLPEDHALEQLDEACDRLIKSDGNGESAGYLYRHTYAAKVRNMIAQARAALGPADEYGYLQVVDKTGIEPTRFQWLARDSGKGWRGRDEEDDEPMPPGPWKCPGDAFGHEMKGTVYRSRRYETRQSFLEEYQPKGRAELDEASVKREARALEKEAQGAPLFADQIRSEGKAPRRKRS